MGKSTISISMAIFHGYFDITRGYIKSENFNIAIENTIQSGCSHEKLWFSSSLCKRLPEGKFH